MMGNSSLFIRSLFLIYFLWVSGPFILAQNTIDNIYIEPANPTSLDSIKVYADLTFHSSGCGLDNKYFSVAGNAISASAHHCLGMAMAICSTKDTFMIGPLPDGAYTFDLTLTSGFGNVPCTPGVAVDDIKTFDFNVGNVVGISQHISHASVFYSPEMGGVNVELPNAGLYVFNFYDFSGRCVKREALNGRRFILNTSEFDRGLYILITEGHNYLDKFVLVIN